MTMRLDRMSSHDHITRLIQLISIYTFVTKKKGILSMFVRKDCSGEQNDYRKKVKANKSLANKSLTNKNTSEQIT